ncbi:hypothetical protein MtrunA17_Chr6g0487841 [Medicago truncatula]|uniref:Uncharacterized protein n=1 Tax=Medicago truncatula TaxID=3880 RepID=A0A396HP29_MEDTR|nr:hypothetical protein MtrunA17_Chr6g0487841 [Medicago truncatula]
MSCKIFGIAIKSLKESDMVVTQPSNNFGRYSFSKIEFENSNTTILKSKNNNFKMFPTAMSIEEITY